MRHKIFLGFLIGFHILIILYGGYFLSPEFSLYPYLSAHNFLPYVNIIDQHFPVIFFGPLSLPSWAGANPQPLLSVFLFLTITTDLMLFRYLKNNKSFHVIFYLFIYICLNYLVAGGNILWLDSIIGLLFLSIVLLGSGSNKVFFFVIGLFSATILLIKPSTILAIILLVWYLRPRQMRYIYLGAISIFLTSFFYLIYYNIFTDFVSLVFKFNSSVYLHEAIKLPSIKQALFILLIVILSGLSSFSKRKFIFFLISLSFLSLLLPRFDPVHLQPWLLVSILIISQVKLPSLMLITSSIVVLFLVFFRLHKYQYGNFYLTPEVINLAHQIKQINPANIYILGGSDLLYPQSSSLPPGKFYLPSLPWYLSQDKFVNKQIQILKENPDTLIIFNSAANIDQISIFSYAEPLLRYFKENHEIIDQIGNYQLYKRKI